MYGDRIRELRLSKRMTQAELATQIKGNQNTLRMWELEISKPNIETLIMLADFFGVTIDYLVGRSDAKDRPCIPEDELLLPPMARGEYALLKKEVTKLILACSPKYFGSVFNLLQDLFSGLIWAYGEEYANEAITACPLKRGYGDEMSSYILEDIERIENEFIAPLRKELISVATCKYSAAVGKALKAAVNSEVYQQELADIQTHEAKDRGE